MLKKIRVLIVDDSAVMRKLLTAILDADPNMEVIGSAPDSAVAEQKINIYKPDVVTLDVEMPGVDGITFLEKLMKTNPMPVVMISSVTKKGAEVTLRALELGAVDFVTKPNADLGEGIDDLVHEIRAKVRTAAFAHVSIKSPVTPQDIARIPNFVPPKTPASNSLIAIGASAGGTNAIQDILERLPSKVPAIAIVQHMPPRFTALFAERLNQKSRITVKEAKDGDILFPGTALVAPGGKHLEVVRYAKHYKAKVYEGEKVNLHRPSVDVLFKSVAGQAKDGALGVILTGMGNDGAKGMLEMRQAGAYTIAQDEATSIVFGMPDQAIRLGGVVNTLPLSDIADSVMRWSIANGEADGYGEEEDGHTSSV